LRLLIGRVHGNWVDGDVLGTKKELIDMSGVPETPYAKLPRPNETVTAWTSPHVKSSGVAPPKPASFLKNVPNGDAHY